MIFESQSGYRRALVYGVLGISILFLLALGIDVVAGLFAEPALMAIPADAQTAHRAARAKTEIEATTGSEDGGKAVNAGSSATPTRSRSESPNRQLLLRPTLCTAFVLGDDTQSLAAYRKHAQQLDAVFPTWFFIDSPDGALRHRVRSSLAQTIPVPTGGAILPVISNSDMHGNWHVDELARLLDNTAAGDRLIAELQAELIASKAAGINVDFEQLSPAERDNFLLWLKRLTTSFHAANLLVTVDVPLNDDAFDYEYIGQIADLVVLMAYDQNYATGSPGPVAGNRWVTESLDELVQRIPSQKIILALGAYGYDWDTTAHEPAKALSFTEAMLLADDEMADVRTDLDDVNPYFNYTDDRGHHHEVWLLDAVTAWNQHCIGREYHVRGYSLWRLGLEEPGVWDFLSSSAGEGPFRPSALAEVHAEPSVAFFGEGELLRVNSKPFAGRRELTFDGERIDFAAYQKLPKYYTVERSGHSSAKQIALTFDDGPNAQWTPQLLRVLREQHVPAAFFVVGDEVQRHPEVVREEFAEGHLIGNHTFFHPDLRTVSDQRVRTELNATQRAIESELGRGTKLFRAPFDTDTSPTTPAELLPLYTVTTLGYVTVGGDIDSQDYDRPGATAIVRHVLDGLRSDGPNIVVLHDGGGDRSQTVAAVAKLIPLLRERGYDFVGLETLMHSSREALMPPMPGTEQTLVVGSQIVRWIRTAGWQVIVILFFATTALSIGRILFLGTVMLRARRRSLRPESFVPDVLVVIPAYNEEKVIGRTLDALLKSDYPKFKVLVVDDGSRDRTAEIVTSYSLNDPRVQLRTKPNGGKWSALNAGFRTAVEEYIVTIDADTIVLPDTITQLVAPFVAPSVDAVCGNVEVGNAHNLLTKFQEVEYITTQNYDRRAFDVLNCISVVPGATGAWKRDYVLRVGGYSEETLTEDADLTLTLLSAGARIVYAPKARAVTEAPETTRALFKQRVRWAFGTFQCLWKHRAQFFRGTLGYVALPNLFLFQIIYPLLSPFGDFVFLVSLLRGDMGAIAAGYGLFLAMDLVGSYAAFRLDGRGARKLWVVFLQRFYYRQFMYVVTFRAMLRAVKGKRQHWNKLERTASVAMPTHR